MEETYDQKKRRLFGKQNLSKYFSILKEITFTDEIKDFHLLSIVETDEYFKKSNGDNFQKIYSRTIEFNDRDIWVKIALERMKLMSKVFLWIALSTNCGIVILDSPKDLNLNFSFDFDSNGIIVLTSIDFKNKIVLDCCEENGDRFMEISYYESL